MIDHTTHNLELIASTYLHSMTVEEVVAAEDGIESKFHLHRGVWWREVKPMFYHPVAFMKPMIARTYTPASYVALGGYYHMATSESEHNGSITVNEIGNPACYDLVTLRKQVRYDIRRALTSFRISRVDSLDVFLGDGLRIYRHWENRVKDLRVKRSNPEVFRTWATGLLKHPYKMILGAFDGDRLVAFIIADAVEGTAQLSKCFTDPEYYPLSPASGLIYSYIKICANNTHIGKACNGLRSLNASLEQYKVRLGFQSVTYPAYISIAAPIRPIVRWFFPTQYRRLMGQYDTIASPAREAPPA